MATVQTVKGPVDTSALGHVLMHEHVFVLSPEIDQNYPAFDEEAEVKNALRRVWSGFAFLLNAHALMGSSASQPK